MWFLFWIQLSNIRDFKCYVLYWWYELHFCWVFHVTPNGHYTLLKNDGDHLGSLDSYSDPASRMHQGNVLCFVKALEFWGEINKLWFNVRATSPDLSHRFFVVKQLCFTALYWDWCTTQLRILILHKLFYWLLEVHVNASNLLFFQTTQQDAFNKLSWSCSSELENIL